MNAACRVNPADKTGTVEAGTWRGAAPNIGPTQILFSLRDQRRKGRVGKGLARNGIVTSGVIAASAACVNVIPQIRLVAFELQGYVVDFLLFGVQEGAHYHGEGLVLEPHMENVILIRHFIGVGVGRSILVRPCVRFGAVAYLNFLGQRQFILRLKQGPEFSLHILPGVGAKLGNQVRGQLIGIVAQLVHLIAVLVIAGVGALNVVDFLPELVFKSRIVLVGP